VDEDAQVSYLVLARKWRPQTFADLIGQDHVSQTLKNAIESGRVAHAFLFTGARGVGKTSAARILAKALNCERGPTPEPCNDCPACSEITSGASVDVFEIDGASNTGVDDIRDLRDTVKYLPARCRYKIFIIDEVHMLSTNAFNALLKTLEEPPAHVKFIFATTEPHKLPITILSRCQRFDFKRIPLAVIASHLRNIVTQEKIAITDSGLTMIARKGDGSMRDALSVLDQVLAFCGEQVMDEEVVTLLGVVDRRLLLEASEAVFARDCSAALDIVKRVDSFGYNMRQFCQELIDHFRSMAIIKAVGPAAALPDLSEAEILEIRKQAAPTKLDSLQRYLAILLKAESEMSHSTFPRLILEMALLKMATLVPIVPVNEILDRLKALEGMGSSGMVASPSPSWKKSPSGRDGASTNTISPEPEQIKAATSSPSRRQNPEKPDIQLAPVNDKGGGGTLDPWEGFVASVKGNKPMLATFLEHGHPLRISAALLEIGFPTGSFQLSSLQDPAAMADLCGLAKAFFGSETAIHLVALTEDAREVPATLSVKKNLEKANKLSRLKEVALSHPMVAAALEIFGGEIADIDKAEEINNK
jgi:DNA polymerase-3 subunit gamma/tau